MHPRQDLGEEVVGEASGAPLIVLLLLLQVEEKLVIHKGRRFPFLDGKSGR